MRKLLFVHEEQHVDHAHRSVQDLLDFGQRSARDNTASDLLAVLVLSPDVVHAILLAEQECALRPSPDGSPLFGSDSVSLSGVWTLVTLSRRDIQEPVTRNEALYRLLGTLQSQGFVQDPERCFSYLPAKSAAWRFASR